MDIPLLEQVKLQAQVLVPLVKALRAELGDVVTYLSPCGGGYGHPLNRDPAKVLDDLLDGYITPDHAREVYGVVFQPVQNGFGWGLDAEGTSALRARMRAA